MTARCRAAIVNGLERLCTLLDNVPRYQDGRWYRRGCWGCQFSLAARSYRLAERWGVECGAHRARGPLVNTMTAREWRTVVFGFVLACVAILTAAVAYRTVDHHLHPTCAVRLASDRSWTPVDWNDGLPPAGCRIVVTQLQEAGK